MHFADYGKFTHPGTTLWLFPACTASWEAGAYEITTNNG